MSEDKKQNFATDVLEGLSHSPKHLSCKYIYDERGSEIFKQIMDLPEYYLTACEMEILKNHKEKMVHLIKNPSLRLVELGAGNGEKTKIILREMKKNKIDFTFNPIDLSHSAINELTLNIKKDIPDIHIEGQICEYFDGLKWLASLDKRLNVVLFLGSNIGNFNPREMDIFLSNLREACNEGDFLLIGFDLKKDNNLIIKAYNDAKGVTAQFNLNLLHRINGELGGHFNVGQFEYFSTYDTLDGAVKSYLISLKDQSVYIDKLNHQFSFSRRELIHTESSFKYNEGDINNLADKNGFVVVKNFFDSKKYFVDSLWRVQKK